MKNSVFISAGDPSGEIYAKRIAEVFIKNGWKVSATGGKLLKKLNLFQVVDLVSNATMGFWEPLKNLSFFVKAKRNIASFTKKEKPKIAVLIDFWGFHSQLFNVLKENKVSVYYYVSPQIWASRFGRIKKIKKFVKKIFIIYPFEAEIYKKFNIPVSFYGHPLTQIIPSPQYNPNSKIIGLLPGSRKSEVQKILPVLIKASALLKKIFDEFEFICFKSPSLDLGAYKNIPSFWKIVADENFEMRKKLLFAITCSGTATLENALLGIPQVVVYKTSFLSYAIAKRIVKTKYISLPNIIFGEKICPELIQEKATPSKIANVSLKILKNDKLSMSEKFLNLREKIEGKGIEEKIFEDILKNEKLAYL